MTCLYRNFSEWVFRFGELTLLKAAVLFINAALTRKLDEAKAVAYLFHYIYSCIIEKISMILFHNPFQIFIY